MRWETPTVDPAVEVGNRLIREGPAAKYSAMKMIASRL